MRGLPWVAVLLSAALALAGCSDGGTSDEPDFEDVEVEVTEDTGAVLGVVVDTAIQPVAKATVTLSGDNRTAETDERGRFSFSKVSPGAHFLTVTKPGYTKGQSSVDVVAGLETPGLVKIQIERLFDQDPFSEQVKFQGFLACGYQTNVVARVTAPCVTDYTSIVVSGGAAPQLREVQGDTRDYLVEIGDGWQRLVFEMTWEPSAQGTATGMHMTVSQEERTAADWFASYGSANPMRFQVDVGVPGPEQQGQPEMIPPSGHPALLVFMNVDGMGDPFAMAVNQGFEVIQSNFYFGLPPEDWSFIAGDELPF